VLPSGEEKKAYEINGKFYIGGNEVRCGCTGKTKETSSPFVWNRENSKLTCSICGKEIKVKKPEEIPLRLVPAGQTEDFGMVWRLNRKINIEEWVKVQHLFFYAKADMGLGLEADEKDLGWVTARPAEVEKVLGIPPERSYRELEKKEEEARRKREDMLRIKAEEKAAIELLYSQIWYDWSWDDYSYKIGEKVYETEHYAVYEYFKDGKFVGYTIKDKDHKF
jgi:hypothetical protein